jgi:RNA polymerase sigma-70 factor (ECF subfamily)
MPLTDEQLIAEARRDPGAAPGLLDELFRRHYARVALWCLRFTGDRERAADLTQDIFLKLRNSLHTFQGEAKFTTWLYSICRNHCFNEIRARRNPAESVPEDEWDRWMSDSPDHDGRIDRDRRFATAQEWLARLEPLERQVFTLHYAEEMPLDSITRLLALTNASGAKAYIVSARRKLSEMVRRWRNANES